MTHNSFARSSVSSLGASAMAENRSILRRSNMVGRVCLASALLLGMLVVSVSRADLFGPSGKDVDAKRATVLQQRDQMLNELYATRPDLKERISKAVGYATFRKTDVNLFLLASGNGYGVLVNNRTNKQTFMRVASLGGGIGLGVKDLRVIFVFNDEKVMTQFVEQGWEFNGSADASAKYQDTGAAAEHSVKANPDFKDGTVSAGSSTDVRAGAGDKAGATGATGGPMEIYQFTESGISLQAVVAGTKYWKDSALNK